MKSERFSDAASLPFEAGAFRLTMGLQPLAEAHWIERDDHLAADLAAKRALLDHRHGEVFAALPEAAAASAELLECLTETLCRFHGAAYRRQGTSLHCVVTAETWDLTAPALHPLDLAGRIVQEDLCVLQAQGDGAYRLTAASLCSPARWRLAEKIGRPLAVLHAPVPGYDTTLSRPVDRFIGLVKADKPVWRLNWGIMDDPTRFQPEAAPPVAGIDAANAGEHLWLRVERQTLRRLPVSNAVIFTIRTYIARLSQAIAPGTAAARLAETIRTMPAEMLAYKRITGFAPALLAWLDARH